MLKGYINVASVVPSVSVGNCVKNRADIKKYVIQAEKDNIQIVSFPELCMTGYTCGDLFNDSTLLDEAISNLKALLYDLQDSKVIYIIGCPIENNSVLYNCAVVCQGNSILGIIPKSYLPNYKEFYEKRWFGEGGNNIYTEMNLFGEDVPFGTNLIFKTPNGIKFAVEICEDLWSPIPPSSKLCLEGAQIIFNLSASNDLIGKNEYLKSLIKQQSARTISGYVYSSCGFGESTTDVVFGGKAFVYENGKQLNHSEQFSLTPQYIKSTIDVESLNNERRLNTTFRKSVMDIIDESLTIDTFDLNDDAYSDLPTDKLPFYREFEMHPFVPEETELKKRYKDIIAIQSLGLAKRLRHINCEKVVIGVSGGLDSTLALLVCNRTYDILGLDKKGIIGVTMPCFGTTKRTHENSIKLMEAIGMTTKDIDITSAVQQHFSDIDKNPDKADVTFENCQARERTQVLMDIANKVGGIVIGTGDMSELALGWCTYNADHMSMYNVNVSIPKTLVKSLVKCYSEETDNVELSDVLTDIIDTPISPELLPSNENDEITQKTEDKIGPYELHDFFLYYFIRHNFSMNKIWYIACIAFKDKYSECEIAKWLSIFIKRFFSQQFKRSCLPDGPKVGSISLSPRGDWRMPSDADVKMWSADIQTILWVLKNEKGEC